MTETPDQVHGRLTEAMHLSGYSFERAMGELENLLRDNRWQRVSPGYTDIDGFLGTVDLARFRHTIEQRKRVVTTLKKLQATQRATGKVLGVSEATVNRDLAVTNVTKPARRHVQREAAAVTNVTTRQPDWFEGDVDPAKLAKGRSARKQRDQEAEARKVEEARAEAAAIGADIRVELREGDFREVLADLRSVDAIVTDPPYGSEHLPLLADLAAWADEVLSDDGVLIVLMGQYHLPDAFRLLSEHRPYRWTGCYLTEGPAYVAHGRAATSNWKPLLVYGGTERRLVDVVHSDGEVSGKERHVWEQAYSAFSSLIGQLTLPGQTVVDPFAGSGTTLAAARDLGRHAIGAEIDPVHAQTARERLAL